VQSWWLLSATRIRVCPQGVSAPSPAQAELYRERATVLVVDEGEGTVGWAVGWAVPQEIHLMNVAVHPEHQRKGHARALLTALFDQHRCSSTGCCCAHSAPSGQVTLTGLIAAHTTCRCRLKPLADVSVVAKLAA
jgi:GNAT superfamily N-acetyltransferase